MTPSIPPSPAPINQALSGGTWIPTSGNLQTSALGVKYAEYTQWLTIDYVRNPDKAVVANQIGHWDLVSISGIDTGSINATQLQFNITAHTSCKFVTAAYNASSFQQNQKFTLNALANDKFGTSYGVVSGATNEFVFGPQGSIVTSQPYIRRELATSADVEYSLTQVGCSNGVRHFHRASWDPIGVTVWGDGSDLSMEYRSYLAGYLDINRYKQNQSYADVGDFPGPWNTDLANADVYALLGGAYSTSSEEGFGSNTQGAARLIQFIEFNCGVLGRAAGVRRYLIPQPVASSEPSGNVQEADYLPSNPYYDTSRHEY